MGTYCWLRFDGETDLGTIAEGLEAQFGDRADAAGERVVRFAQALAGEGWVEVRREDEPEE
jgi:hypothetical protein